MEKFKTPGGKEIELYHSGYMIKARFVGGGELPASLAGAWTSFPHAKNDILVYLASKAKEEKPKKQTTTEKLGLNPDDYKR